LTNFRKCTIIGAAYFGTIGLALWRRDRARLKKFCATLQKRLDIIRLRTYNGAWPTFGRALRFRTGAPAPKIPNENRSHLPGLAQGAMSHFLQGAMSHFLQAKKSPRKAG
jgi:hypothetical protein